MFEIHEKRSHFAEMRAKRATFEFQQVLGKISNLREIRILKFFVKKIRQIKVRSALRS